MIEHIVGFVASSIAFILFLPQAIKTWRLRNDSQALRGVALGTQALLISNALLWFAYGWITSAFWIAAPGFINLPLALATIGLVLRARGTDDEVDCELCRTGVWHRIFITEPAGWGSVMRCDGHPDSRGVTVTSQEQISAIRASDSTETFETTADAQS